jgi:hypothetical protein
MRLAVVVASVVIVVAGSSRGALAYRPFDGTDADVAEPDTIELELGPLQAEHTGGASAYTPGGVFNYGVADGYELVVDADGVVPLGDAPGHGVALTDVLVKHVFRAGSLQDGHGPSVALETGVLLPGVPATGVDEAGWIADVIVSQRWSRVTIHVNATGFYGRDRRLGGFASAIVEGPADWRVRPVAELLAERDDGASTTSLLGGAIWQRGKSLAFDAAAVVQDDGGATNLELRIGLTWAFETPGHS